MKSIAPIALIALTGSCAVLSGVPARAARPLPVADSSTQAVVLDHCSWNHPGVNPFMGDVVAAVDHYPDIAPDVRARLKARMEKREYDDLVSIRRDRIEGRGGYDYGNTISDMHYGTRQLCRSVTRAAWTPEMQERGLVYCEGGQCILVPTVCRNVSRITRSGVGPDAAALPPLLAAAPAVDGFPPIDYFGPAMAGVPAGAPVEGGVVGAPPLEGTAGGYPFMGFGAGPLIGGGFAGGMIIGGLLGGGTEGARNPVATGAAGPEVPGAGLVAGGGPANPAGGPAASSGGGAAGADITPVPEPSTPGMLAIGLTAIAWLARRRSADRE